MDIKDALSIKDLIVRDLEGNLTLRERKMLDEWIDHSSENRKLYQKFSSDDFMREVVKDEQGALKKRWDKLEEIIKQGQRRRRTLKMWSYAAAVLILISVVSTVFLLRTPFEGAVPVVANQNETDIPSGIRIQLADGRIVPLQDSTEDFQTEDLSLVSKKDSILLSSISTAEASSRWNTILTPKGKDYVVKLEEGTVVHLNAESSLEVPSKFSGHERRVVLHGEAYFNVAHEANRPFIVETERAKVKVLGTQFNVKAYKENEHLLATLVDGSVEISSTTQQLILRPGMQAAVSSSNAISSYPVNTALYTAWMDKRLVFDNQSVGEIVNELSHWYDYEFVITDPAILQLRFSINMERADNFGTIKTVFESTEKIKFDIEGKKVRIKMQ